MAESIRNIMSTQTARKTSGGLALNALAVQNIIDAGENLLRSKNSEESISFYKNEIERLKAIKKNVYNKEKIFLNDMKKVFGLNDDANYNFIYIKLEEFVKNVENYAGQFRRDSELISRNVIGGDIRISDQIQQFRLDAMEGMFEDDDIHAYIDGIIKSKTEEGLPIDIVDIFNSVRENKHKYLKLPERKGNRLNDQGLFRIFKLELEKDKQGNFTGEWKISVYKNDLDKNVKVSAKLKSIIYKTLKEMKKEQKNKQTNSNNQTNNIIEEQKDFKTLVIDRIRFLIDQKNNKNDPAKIPFKQFLYNELQSNRVKNYALEKKESSVIGFVGEIWNNAMFNYLVQVMETIPTGLARDVLNNNKQIGVDMIFRGHNFQIKNYTLHDGIFNIRNSEGIGSYISHRLRVQEPYNRILIEFFGAYQFNQVYNDKTDYESVIYNRFNNNNLKEDVGELFSYYLDNDLRVTNYFKTELENKMQLEEGYYYNSFFIINNMLIPSSVILGVIIQELANNIKEGSLISYNINSIRDQKESQISKEKKKQKKDAPIAEVDEYNTLGTLIEKKHYNGKDQKGIIQGSAEKIANSVTIDYTITMNYEKIFKKALSKISQSYYI